MKALQVRACRGFCIAHFRFHSHTVRLSPSFNPLPWLMRVSEWDILKVLPPPPLVLSYAVEKDAPPSCEPHWEFGCVGGVSLCLIKNYDHLSANYD
jgi:hypothetical protein